MEFGTIEQAIEDIRAGRLVIVADALKELSEAEKRTELIQEARQGIAEFRSMINEIEAAVNAGNGMPRFGSKRYSSVPGTWCSV